MSFTSGFFFGFATVGTYTYQTLKVLGGQPLQTFFASLAVSLMYWVSINRIVGDDVVWYGGFTAGAAFATTGLAYLEARKREEQKG